MGNKVNKNLFIVIVLLLLGTIFLYASEYIDVVKTKDGDVYKGIIIENKLNKYVRIETSGGSTFKVDYKDIDSILKELDTSAGSDGSFIINNTNTNTQTQIQNTGSPKSKEIPIRFTPKQGIFSKPYYTYYGVKYPLSSFGSGYINLATAIKNSVQPDHKLQKLLDDYSKSISTAMTMTWGGFAAAMGGVFWGSVVYANTMDSGSYPQEGASMSNFIFNLTGPAILYFGGLIVEIIGTSRAAKEPVELVTYYNSNY